MKRPGDPYPSLRSVPALPTAMPYSDVDVDPISELYPSGKLTLHGWGREPLPTSRYPADDQRQDLAFHETRRELPQEHSSSGSTGFAVGASSQSFKQQSMGRTLQALCPYQLALLPLTLFERLPLKRGTTDVPGVRIRLNLSPSYPSHPHMTHVSRRKVPVVWNIS